MRVRRLSVARARPRATSPSLRARWRAAEVGLRARNRVGGFRVRLRRRRLRRRHSFAERLDLGTRFHERRLRAPGPPREPLLPLASRTPTRLEERLDLALERFLSASMPFPFFTAFVIFTESSSFFRVAASRPARPRAQPLVRRQASPRFRRNVRRRRQRPIARRRVPPPHERIRRRLCRRALARRPVRRRVARRSAPWRLRVGSHPRRVASPSPRARVRSPHVREGSPTRRRSPRWRRRKSPKPKPSTGEEEHPGEEARGARAPGAGARSQARGGAGSGAGGAGSLSGTGAAGTTSVEGGGGRGALAPAPESSSSVMVAVDAGFDLGALAPFIAAFRSRNSSSCARQGEGGGIHWFDASTGRHRGRSPSDEGTGRSPAVRQPRRTNGIVTVRSRAPSSCQPPGRLVACPWRAMRRPGRRAAES